MAKAVGFIGSIRGKVGNVVYRNRRGVQIASVYQPTVLNPKTARQSVTRQTFAIATRFAKAIKLFLRAGLQAVHPSYECQRFVGSVVPLESNCFTLSGDIVSVDYPMLASHMAAGELGVGLETSGLSFATESEVDFHFVCPDSFRRDEGGNPVNIGLVTCVYCPDINQGIVQQKVVRDQSDYDIAVLVPSVMSGMKVQVYCFVKQIPNSNNLMPSVESPWMYPARTSTPVWVGEGTIA